MRSNLINFRKQLGMTQEDFGKLFILSKQQISNIESAKRYGTQVFWLSLQERFNLSNKETLDLMEVIPNERT